MSEFLVSIPLRVLRERILRPANERVREGGEYTEDEATLSLLVDVDDKDVRAKAAYARIWGWTRHKVRYNWPELWQAAALWASSYGRQIDGPIAKKLPPKWRRWLDENHRRPTATRPPEDRHPTATSPPETRPTRGAEGDPPPPSRQATATEPPDDRQATATHTIHPSSLHPSSFKTQTDRPATARAREAGADPPEDDPADGRSVGKEDFEKEDRVEKKDSEQEDSEQEDLVRALEDCGLSTSKAEELAASYPAREILDQIASYRWRCEHGQAPSSAGWIAWALGTGEPLPEGLRRSRQAAPRSKPHPKPRSTYVEPDGPPADPDRVSEAMAAIHAKLDAAKTRAAKSHGDQAKSESRRERRRPDWARAGPTETRPTDTQPTDTQPAETQPAETQPNEAFPDEPAASRPLVHAPSSEGPPPERLSAP